MLLPRWTRTCASPQASWDLRSSTEAARQLVEATFECGELTSPKMRNTTAVLQIAITGLMAALNSTPQATLPKRSTVARPDVRHVGTERPRDAGGLT